MVRGTSRYKSLINVVHVVGARPNFMKAAPVFDEMRKIHKLRSFLVHTGQHYDRNMSKVFFEDLELPRADISLNIGSFSQTTQMARIMLRFEESIKNLNVKLVIVYGDVTSTIACALAAKKMGIMVAHVEAGLRSYDRDMPEEINRVATDAISDILFTPSEDANENLLKEGIDKHRIHFVGNTMIDSLSKNIKRIESSNILRTKNLQKEDYVVLTLHRPSNVDNIDTLNSILVAINNIAQNFKVVFPVHPRTSKNIKSFFAKRGAAANNNLIAVSPMRYFDFMKLIKDSYCTLTDSGGIQEETTFLGIPCLTLRKSTERPITVCKGTNTVVGIKSSNILKHFEDIGCKRRKNKPIALWDGKASKRIVKIIKRLSLGK